MVQLFNIADFFTGLTAFLTWATHDFWRVLAVVWVLRALFSWRLLSVSTTKTEASTKKVAGKD